ncbi:MAG: L-seryl-tRNA(Sec) selenium transferase [Pseudomonadota bacterium]
MGLPLRDLPGIDRLLNDPALAAAVQSYGPGRIKELLRELQNEWRGKGEAPEWASDAAVYAETVTRRLGRQSYTPVFNLTGTIIHTNLGRALVSEAVYEAVAPLVTQPMNLEYDLDAGKRGDREKFVEDRLTLLTGAEAATVVNNGAAALMLMLNSLALGRSVPVSRGELIEIGGSFRLPDIMSRSGCRLVEVGTTNRTHLKDYAAAIDADTAMLLKVHPSNYHIEGFTKVTEARELAELAQTNGLPMGVDLGSGTLVDLTRYGLPHEPMPQEVLAQGADLVSFSGDKLLGATQAGIIVGKAEFIAELKANPMKRALRPDKLTLAFLEQTLKLYDEPEKLAETLPLLRTMTTPEAELNARGAKLCETLTKQLPDFAIELCDSACQIGSGSLPDRRIPSRAIRIEHRDEAEIRELLDRLRALPVPVIGRLNQGAAWLDLRGAARIEALCENLAGLSGAP